ncbi:hypothetical protein T484DRAFT_1858916 [Baffinella frigidus]|nr:hypothetical protein T484DRAFT_1858916 [Cryptophyta sp. CCMP2293]
MLMRAQLEAGLAAMAAMKVALDTQVQAFQTQNAAEVQTLTTSVETSVQTLTTSVAASVAAVEGNVANMSITVSGLSTTVSGLSTVAATGDFSDLSGRPSAVSAITVEAEITVSSSSGSQKRDLGAHAGKYCALTYDRYTLHP